MKFWLDQKGLEMYLYPDKMILESLLQNIVVFFLPLIQN